MTYALKIKSIVSYVAIALLFILFAPTSYSDPGALPLTNLKDVEPFGDTSKCDSNIHLNKKALAADIKKQFNKYGVKVSQCQTYFVDTVGASKLPGHHCFIGFVYVCIWEPGSIQRLGPSTIRLTSWQRLGLIATKDQNILPTAINFINSAIRDIKKPYKQDKTSYTSITQNTIAPSNLLPSSSPVYTYSLNGIKNVEVELDTTDTDPGVNIDKKTIQQSIQARLQNCGIDVVPSSTKLLIDIHTRKIPGTNQYIIVEDAHLREPGSLLRLGTHLTNVDSWKLFEPYVGSKLGIQGIDNSLTNEIVDAFVKQYSADNQPEATTSQTTSNQ